MRHNLEVSVINPTDDDVVRCKKVNIRERIMRLLFGEMRRMWIVIPGGMIDALSICEISEGGKSNEPN